MKNEYMSLEEKDFLIKKLWSYVSKSLDLLYENDMHLIDNSPFYNIRNGNHHVGERSIVFRFAFYFQQLIDQDDVLSQYNLDCEYNRNGTRCKALPSFKNGVYPDIILHKRGSNDSNTLVMEFKTYWNRNQSNDIEKLKEFTAPEGEYRFVFGIAILIEKSRECVKCIPVVNGEIESNLMFLK